MTKSIFTIRLIFVFLTQINCQGPLQEQIYEIQPIEKTSVIIEIPLYSTSCKEYCTECINNDVCLRCDIGYFMFIKDDQARCVKCPNYDMADFDPVSLNPIIKCSNCVENPLNWCQDSYGQCEYNVQDNDRQKIQNITSYQFTVNNTQMVQTTLYEKCFDGTYFDWEDSLLCMQCPDQCIKCYSKTVCSKCKSGYYLDPSLQCLNCNNIQNCAECVYGVDQSVLFQEIYDNDDDYYLQCTQCLFPWVNTQDKRTCIVKCDGIQNCIKCYYTDDDPSKSTLNSHTYKENLVNQNGPFCARCETDFVLFSNSSGCQIQDQNSNPLQYCKSHQILINNTYKCLECFDGHVLSFKQDDQKNYSNGFCLNDLCSDHNCLNCYQQFQIDIDSNCIGYKDNCTVLRTICSKCKNGFYFDIQTGICLECDGCILCEIPTNTNTVHKFQDMLHYNFITEYSFNQAIPQQEQQFLKYDLFSIIPICLSENQQVPQCKNNYQYIPGSKRCYLNDQIQNKTPIFKCPVEGCLSCLKISDSQCYDCLNPYYSYNFPFQTCFRLDNKKDNVYYDSLNTESYRCYDKNQNQKGCHKIKQHDIYLSCNNEKFNGSDNVINLKNLQQLTNDPVNIIIQDKQNYNDLIDEINLNHIQELIVNVNFLTINNQTTCQFQPPIEINLNLFQYCFLLRKSTVNIRPVDFYGIPLQEDKGSVNLYIGSQFYIRGFNSVFMTNINIYNLPITEESDTHKFMLEVESLTSVKIAKDLKLYDDFYFVWRCFKVQGTSQHSIFQLILTDFSNIQLINGKFQNITNQNSQNLEMVEKNVLNFITKKGINTMKLYVLNLDMEDIVIYENSFINSRGYSIQNLQFNGTLLLKSIHIEKTGFLSLDNSILNSTFYIYVKQIMISKLSLFNGYVFQMNDVGQFEIGEFQIIDCQPSVSKDRVSDNNIFQQSIIISNRFKCAQLYITGGLQGSSFYLSVEAQTNIIDSSKWEVKNNIQFEKIVLEGLDNSFTYLFKFKAPKFVIQSDHNYYYVYIGHVQINSYSYLKPNTHSVIFYIQDAQRVLIENFQVNNLTNCHSFLIIESVERITIKSFTYVQDQLIDQQLNEILESEKNSINYNDSWYILSDCVIEITNTVEYLIINNIEIRNIILLNKPLIRITEPMPTYNTQNSTQDIEFDLKYPIESLQDSAFPDNKISDITIQNKYYIGKSWEQKLDNEDLLFEMTTSSILFRNVIIDNILIYQNSSEELCPLIIIQIESEIGISIDNFLIQNISKYNENSLPKLNQDSIVLNVNAPFTQIFMRKFIMSSINGDSLSSPINLIAANIIISDSQFKGSILPDGDSSAIILQSNKLGIYNTTFQDNIQNRRGVQFSFNILKSVTFSGAAAATIFISDCQFMNITSGKLGSDYGMVQNIIQKQGASIYLDIMYSTARIFIFNTLFHNNTAYQNSATLKIMSEIQEIHILLKNCTFLNQLSPGAGIINFQQQLNKSTFYFESCLFQHSSETIMKTFVENVQTSTNIDQSLIPKSLIILKNIDTLRINSSQFVNNHNTNFIQIDLVTLIDIGNTIFNDTLLNSQFGAINFQNCIKFHQLIKQPIKLIYKIQNLIISKLIPLHHQIV